MSATAFFTAMVINLTCFMFEDSADKQQLSLLSACIKSAACHADLLLVTGQTIVVFDSAGAMCVGRGPGGLAGWGGGGHTRWGLVEQAGGGACGSSSRVWVSGSSSRVWCLWRQQQGLGSAAAAAAAAAGFGV